MKNKIQIWIFAEEFKTSNYNSCNDCSLAKALRREGYLAINVGGTTVKVDNRNYVMSVDESLQIMKRTGLENQEPLLVTLNKML